MKSSPVILHASRIVQYPRSLPLHLTAIKAHLYIDHANDDTYITDLIRAAVNVAEERTLVRMVAQQRKVLMDGFPPTARLVIPDVPLLSVSSVTYVDSAGDTQTWDSDDYDMDLDGDARDYGHGHVRPVYGGSWPSARGFTNDVAFTYVAGQVIPFVADATANTLTPEIAAPWADGTAIRLVNSGGALPAALSADTTYYVVTSGATTFQVAATVGGAAIDFTTAGTGTQFAVRADADRGRFENMCHIVRLLVAHWYANREPVVVGQQANRVPDTVDALVGLCRAWF